MHSEQILSVCVHLAAAARFLELSAVRAQILRVEECDSERIVGKWLSFEWPSAKFCVAATGLQQGDFLSELRCRVEPCPIHLCDYSF